eukprot:13404346-Heterocapsa_arctica.AAC.1
MSGGRYACESLQTGPLPCCSDSHTQCSGRCGRRRCDHRSTSQWPTCSSRSTDGRNWPVSTSQEGPRSTRGIRSNAPRTGTWACPGARHCWQWRSRGSASAVS